MKKHFGRSLHKSNKANDINNIKILIKNKINITMKLTNLNFIMKSMLFEQISLIHFENDYLFKKWGINSIYMNNFMAYDYNSIVPSNLTSKIIIMVGRGDDVIKRFDYGIKAMKYIVKEIPEALMKIISSKHHIKKLKELVKELNLKNNVKFVGYKSNPEKYYREAALHIFPTLAEAFPNTLSETLIHGIPNILLGLNYVSTAKGGTVIIYDDSYLSLAKASINILKDSQYRKILGKDARKNMKQYDNNLLLKRWIQLILAIYKGDIYYERLRNKDKKMSKENAKEIIKSQIKLLKMRKEQFKNITIENIENFTYMENL